ncbi:MAG TPA: anthranilate phosphoribosyltransferase [bacterium]|nr:anthranilate phosphoribosyltransferase [bacterium]
MEAKQLVREVMRKLTSREELTEEEIRGIIEGIRDDKISSVQIGGFLVALLMKGQTVREIAYIAKAMRDVALPLNPDVPGELVDTCGTGGGLPTFNISTATSIVAAAGGLYVAKHGSRSISHLSGSADAFEALGVNIELEPSEVEELIEKIGICFLFASLFHPVMGKVWEPERELGIKTIFFTIIGPLINPARAKCHINGVYKLELVRKMAEVWSLLPHKHILVVHGVDGLDEISLIGETHIAEVKDGKINEYTVTPEELGLERCKIEDLAPGDPQYNAKVIRDIFEGKEKGPKRDAVLLNSAGAFLVGGKVSNLREGIEYAKKVIDEGKALEKLEQYIKASHEIKKKKKL